MTERERFEFIKESPANYYYIDRHYTKRYNRMKFQKHKLKSLLENFNEELTEKENMENNGFDRIWDCGNNFFIFNNEGIDQKQ